MIVVEGGCVVVIVVEGRCVLVIVVEGVWQWWWVVVDGTCGES